MNSSEEGEAGESEGHIDCPFLGFRVLHQVWEGGSEDERQDDQEENDEDGPPKCSTQTSSMVGMTLSQPMSDITSENSESLVVKDKLTREDAKDILDKTKTATEATEVALQTLIGEDIKNFSEDEHRTILKLVEKFRVKLQRFEIELKRKKKKALANPNDTFVNLSFYPEMKRFREKAKENEVQRRCQEDTQESQEAARDGSCDAVTGMHDKAVQTDNYQTFRKTFDQLNSAREQQRRSDQVLQEIRHFSEINDLTVVRSLGYLLYRNYWQTNKKLAILGRQLFTDWEDLVQKQQLDVLTCLWLVERLDLGRTKYTSTRLQLQPYVVLLPYSFPSALRASLVPPMVHYPLTAEPQDQTGVFVRLPEAIQAITLRLLQFNLNQGGWVPRISSCVGGEEEHSNLVVRVLGACDGRGDERQHAQRSQAQLDTSHVFSTVISIPSIHKAVSCPDPGMTS